MARTNAPVIIKRKKIVGGGGHHGGAWKVAYADFVTAMMAFFLLMWLLGATTEKQRKGIADYFNPTLPINRTSGGGDGAFGGESVFTEETFAHNGTGASSLQRASNELAKGDQGFGENPENSGEQADRAFETLQEMLRGMGGESMAAESLARHIVTRVTDDGLIVEIFDLEDAPLFKAGTAEPEPITFEIAKLVTEVFALVENGLAVAGHVQSAPEVVRIDPSWDMSTARAQAMRGLLEAAGFDAGRMQRVTGHADRQPVEPNRMSLRNNRIELTLLRPDRR